MNRFYTALGFILFSLLLVLNINLIYAQTYDIANARVDESATPPSNDQLIKGEDNIDVSSSNNLDKHFASRYSLSNITIIESRSANSGHVMDTVWAYLAGNLGYIPTIMPQSALDNNSFFANTDILIISSGVIDLPANRVNTIMEFIRSGGPVYLQTEYTCGYSSNLAFKTIVDSLGGVFSMSGTLSGDLIPLNVFGALSSNPNQVDTLSYFWYGCAGVADSVTVLPFLEHAGQYFGFAFNPPNPAFGKVITTSDQDWIRKYDTTVNAPLLIENILAYLSGSSLGVNEILLTTPQQYTLLQNFPNPFNPSTSIGYRILKPGNVNLKVYNMLGQEVRTLVNQRQNTGYYEAVWDGTDDSGEELPSGNYFYRLRVNNFAATNRMLLLK